MKTVLIALGSFVLGAVTTVVTATVILAISLQQPPPPTSVPMGTTTSSSIAKDLAAKIAPVVTASLTAHKEDIIASAGGLPARAAVRLGFPTAMRMVPTLTEVGCDAALDRLGGLSLPQLASTVAGHNRAKGRPSHPSIVGSTSAER